MKTSRLTLPWLTILWFSLYSCTQHHALVTPENPTGRFYGTKGESRDLTSSPAGGIGFSSDIDCLKAESIHGSNHYRVDKIIPVSVNQQGRQPISQIFNRDLPLSPGDLVDIYIDEGEGFNGRYVVNPDGRLQMPLLGSIDVAGMGVTQVSTLIEMRLIKNQYFQPTTANVDVRVMYWAEISVAVTGAVFQPGRVRINEKVVDNVIPDTLNAYGDNTSKRSIVEAIRAASGIRPDAKLDQVILIRNGWQLEIDLSGILSGQPTQDITLVDGDQVIVPTTGCFQTQLVRPSEITPKGFRVFMSNLVNPSFDNSGASVGRYSSNIPYGTRLLQAAVSANCVGGTQLTNAPRKVVLASKNPITQEIQVIERSVEQLFRQAHLEDINPYLMPNDALACYDSDVTNIRDFARGVSEILSPIKIFL